MIVGSYLMHLTCDSKTHHGHEYTLHGHYKHHVILADGTEKLLRNEFSGRSKQDCMWVRSAGD